MLRKKKTKILTLFAICDVISFFVTRKCQKIRKIDGKS